MQGQKSVSKDFANAADAAKRWTEQEGLFGVVNEDGEVHYRIQQGLKAACLGREDIVASLIIQHAILRRLQSLRTIGLACLALLIYIAARLS